MRDHGLEHYTNHLLASGSNKLHLYTLQVCLWGGRGVEKFIESDENQLPDRIRRTSERVLESSCDRRAGFSSNTDFLFKSRWKYNQELVLMLWLCGVCMVTMSTGSVQASLLVSCDTTAEPHTLKNKCCQVVPTQYLQKSSQLTWKLILKKAVWKERISPVLRCRAEEQVLQRLKPKTCSPFSEAMSLTPWRSRWD